MAVRLLALCAYLTGRFQVPISVRDWVERFKPVTWLVWCLKKRWFMNISLGYCSGYSHETVLNMHLSMSFNMELEIKIGGREVSCMKTCTKKIMGLRLNSRWMLS
jgi:hypothetical protein